MKLLPYFFLASVLTFGQEKPRKYIQKDSITFYLNNAKGSLKSSYLKKAYQLSKEFGNDSLLKKASISLGLDAYFKKDTLALKEVNKSLVYLFQKTEDSISLAKVYHFKALIFRIQNKLDSAFYYYYKSKVISILVKDSLEVGRRLFSMSNMQINGRDYIGAESSIVEALKYLEPLKENVYTYQLYNSLGRVLLRKGEFDEARKYQLKSLSEAESNLPKKRKENWRLLITNNIGYSYLVEGKWEESLPFFKNALDKDSLDVKYPQYYQLLLGNYSDANYLLGNTKEAWKDFWKLLRFREKKNNIFGQSLSHNGFSYYFMREGNNKKALYHARKSYELTKKVNNNATRISSLVKLVKLTSGNESKKYFEEYVSLNDSLRRVELTLKDDFTKISYETEKTENENITLKIDNDRQAAAVEKAEQQRIIGWLVAIALFLTLGLSVTFYKNRRKKLLYESQLEKTIAVQEERTRERNRISQELHDGVLSRLFGIRVNMGFLGFQAHNNVKEQYRSLLEELQDVEREIRDTSHRLHDNSNSDFTMVIDTLLEAKSTLGSFEYELLNHENISWKSMDEFTKENVYRIIQESLQNIIKHANAQKVILTLSLESDKHIIQIEDDGVGFDVKEHNKGIGLKNMHARVQKIKGDIKISSTLGQGTKIVITI